MLSEIIIIRVLQTKQNLKNIMQVRNILQHKKQSHCKNAKNNQQQLYLKQRKRVKTMKGMKTQRSKSKSKSKSNSEKQNIKYRKSQSKSKDKLSPFISKQIKGHNTSPILDRNRTMKMGVSPFKLQERDKYAKGAYSHREYEPGCHTVSTKLNTQRTPIKKNAEKDKIKQGPRKSKKSSKHPKNTKTTHQLIKESKKQKTEQLKTIKEINQKKLKKSVAPIKTQGPQRKESYFDQEVIQKLNLDNAQFFRRKRNLYTSTQEKSQKKNNTSTQLNNPISIQHRQYGTQTIDPYPRQPALTYRDLESFRKQQELKWRIICLELSQLKQTRTAQKIEQIIQESHRNISQFQTKCQEIVQSHNKDNYMVQSPTKIRSALTRRKKSQEQSRSLIKTLSDQRLLQELQNLDNFDDLSQMKNSIRQEKPSSSSFCVEFQKQMEAYTQQNTAPNTNPLSNVELQHIPQLQFEKSIQITNQIQEILYIELCSQFAYSQKLLHSFLRLCNKENLQREEQQRFKEIQKMNQLMKIKCSQTYSIDLFYRLFKFIQVNKCSQQILKRINVPFGSHPLVNLKLLRNYFIQNQQDMFEDEQSIEQVIDSQLLNVFESENSQPIEGQYFYNHCVYSCFNELLDTLRPFGLPGRPPLSICTKPIHRSLSGLFTKILDKLTQILQVKMGKQNFNEYELDLDPLKMAEKSYSLMDKFLIAEQEQKWKKIQDNIVEQKYFLAESIINDIFNEEILMIYNEFI